MKNSADLGGCYPPRPSYPTQPHSIIAKYITVNRNRTVSLSKYYLGSLHMSPPGQLRGLAWSPRSRLATHFFVKMLMCSNNKSGWPCVRYLGFCDRDLCNRDENFPYEHSSASNLGQNFLNKLASPSRHSGQNGIIFLLYLFPLWEHAN